MRFSGGTGPVLHSARTHLYGHFRSGPTKCWRAHAVHEWTNEEAVAK